MAALVGEQKKKRPSVLRKSLNGVWMCGNVRWLTAVGAAVQTEPEKNLKKDVKRSRCELESCENGPVC